MKEKGWAGNRDGREKKREKRDEQTETERKREGEKRDKTKKKKTERQHSRPPCIHRAIIPIRLDPPSLNGHPMNQHPASGQITGR